MPGRHAMGGHRRRRWPRRLAVLLVTLGLVGGGFYVAQDLFLDDAQASCEGSVPVSVVAEPRMAPVITDMIGELETTGELEVDGTCVTVEVTAATSVEVIEGLSADSHPDLWIPESSMWVQSVTAGGISLSVVEPIATSPIVVVAQQPVAQEHLGWPNTEFSWTGVVGGEAPAVISDPMTTSEGLATLLAVQAAMGGDEVDQTQLVRAMTAVSRSAVPDVDSAYDRLMADPTAAPLFTASEQSVVAHNGQHPGSPVVAVYPQEGTLALDYPAIAIESSSTTTQTAGAVRRVIEALTSEAAASILKSAGFRDPHGQARAGAGVVDGVQPQMPVAMPSPDADLAQAARRQWAALSTDMRMLTVIDTSGSMWFADEEGGPLRIDLVREAALVALQMLPPTGEVGVWWFSTDENPPNHWREIVPIRPLHEDVDGQTQLEVLIEATHALPDSDVRGWTALYDTTWAAFQEVKQSYDPDKINSIVLMTDGTDERAPDMEPGMSRETLLNQLRAQHDPARPVPIITIGIGPEADMEALELISEATGTRAYSALDPADIQEVFLQAMLERLCRPNC